MLKQSLLRRYFLLHLILFCLTTINVQAMDAIQFQQQLFYKAQQALEKRDLDSFHALAIELQDYPLYYYLQYQYLKPRLEKVATAEIKSFLRQYGDTYFGEKLRQPWLEKLAAAADWNTFIQFYTPQKSVKLQCDYVRARLITRRDIHQAITDAKVLWLVGKSQPNNCNFAFDYLYEHKLIDNTLLWERIQLALDKGQIGLASSLSNYLDRSIDKRWVTHWKAVHKNPAKKLANFKQSDIAIARQIIVHGIKRLTKKKFTLATEYWERLQTQYAFSIEEIGEVQLGFALASIKQKRKDALVWLTALNKNYLTEKISKTRIRLALEQQNWIAVADFITELSIEEQAKLRWQYWLARAFEEMGRLASAKIIYQKLAKQRDYYGFLAADRINTPYKMQDHPIAATSQDFSQLMLKNSIAAASEFYLLSQSNNKPKWLLNARREWHYAIAHLSDKQKAVAAKLAHRWGWHDRAIITAAKAGHYDDLDVRFPLAFYKEFSAGAKKQGVDLSWAYGIARQESLFMSKVRSHAGAMGLMQLMPATGRLVAKKLNIKLKRTSDILDVNTNVNLGTGYLRQMLERFKGNYMLATAAYNAGPGRAKRWAKKHSCIPADLWVELIPFDETRTYVRRVLFYTRLFEDRLNQPQTQPLRVELTDSDHCTLYSQEKNNRSELPG